MMVRSSIVDGEVKSSIVRNHRQEIEQVCHLVLGASAMRKDVHICVVISCTGRTVHTTR